MVDISRAVLAGFLGLPAMYVALHNGVEIFDAAGALISADTLIFTVLPELFTTMGITGIVDEKGELVGVFTDGDLRRNIEQGIEVLNRPICELVVGKPKRILRTNLAAKSLQRMEKYKITSLVISNDKGEAEGIIHLHDLWRTEMF